jgi:arylsulfatase A-like enzyme
VKVVWLVLDSVRADHVFGGYARTPNLDAWAAEGTRVTRAFASASWTIPSLAAMDTGCWPNEVGVCNWRHALRPELPSAQRTFARCGFEVRRHAPNPQWFFGGWGGAPVGDSQDVAAVARSLAAPGDALVVVHWWWTHLPYVTRPAPWGGRRAATDLLLEALGRDPRMADRLRGLYRAAINHFDAEVFPRWRDAAGPDAVVCVTADHGESWGELGPVRHIFDLHGRHLADATIAVPLAFGGRTARGPVPARVREDGFGRGVDVGPTLVAAAGLPPLERAVGRDLLDDAPLSDHALTVVSANTFTPEHYPADGPSMWRVFGRRDPGGWTTLDTATGALTGDPAHRGALAAHAARSVGPAPGSIPDPVPSIDQASRQLGYLE